MKTNIEHIRNRIKAAAESCGRRPESIQLVAVSKTIPVERVKAAVVEGINIMGENYIQEARAKIEALADMPVSWHFIGHLQRNKAKFAVQLFDLIHSVDSIRLAREIDKQAGKIAKNQAILIQVNTGKEATKTGIYEEDAMALVREAAQLENVRIKGLMTLPPYFNAPDKVRPYFQALRRLRDRIAEEAIPGVEMEALSMGMTGDFETAIEEGATMVRIGTAIFGERS
ncbi:MAG: YggS family pyridoxal phosphate-dependent enzyme [Desulfobacterales bacterium]|nr:YggS family pyridoxal phosphate-dependent enzyme [Desulfobacterales bacterium]